MMSAESRFAIVLAGTLLVGSPALFSALNDELRIEAALVRLALIAGGIWLMVTSLDRVVGGYAQEAATAAAELDAPRRRRDDAVASEESVEPSSDRDEVPHGDHAG